MYRIYPEPIQLNIKSGFLFPAGKFHVKMDPSLSNQCADAGYIFEADLHSLCSSDSCHEYDFSITKETIHPEEYRVSICETGFFLFVGSAAGLFYAMHALKQLSLQCNRSFPFLEIIDRPALDLRGIILDIGRDKVPSMQTLYSLLDKCAAMRINHVELYMEGYCYSYHNYSYLFTDDTPVTPEEFQALDAYARSRFIDLVPSQNTLGHMEQWLAAPQLNSLAECEDGFLFENLYWRPPMTLNTRDEKSLDFVTDMLDDLLANFSSYYVNVNMDEPFELGKGKNREFTENYGISKLYLDYVQDIHQYCCSKGKHMMMWGDQVLENPDSVSSLPKDIMLLDWIYEGDAHFEEHAKLMLSTGLSYCLCPGTSSWGSITGRSDNMIKNIRDAVHCSIKYGAKGIILTDWGDLGHWQYLSSSYPAFCLAGLYSWSGNDASEETAAWFCNNYIYGDRSGNAYRLAYDLGNYYYYEHAPLYNTTLSFAVMSSKYSFDSFEEFDSKIQRLLTLSSKIADTNHIPPKKPVIHMDYMGLQKYLNQLEEKISCLSLDCSEGSLIIEEMKNGIRMIRHGSMLYYSLTEHRKEPELLKSDLKSLSSQLDALLKIHYKLWIARNRSGGFSKSISHMLHLLKFYQREIKELSFSD